MRVRDVMSKEVQCCLPETSIADVSRMMVEHDCGAIPVLDDPSTLAPVGIVTDRDIVIRSIAADLDPFDLCARDCMTSPAATIRDDASLDDCIQLLEVSQIRRAIVVDATGACVGIVAQADIASHASKRHAGDLLRAVSKPSTPVFTM